MSRPVPLAAWGYVLLALLGLTVPFIVYPVFAMNVLCLALFASAFNLLLGYTGLLSFGHAAFLGAAEATDGLVLVEEGSLAVSEQPPGWALGPSLARGAAFGAASLAEAGAAHALGAALAAGPDGATLLRLRRAPFLALFGTLEMAEVGQRVAALRRVPLLAALPPDSMLALAASLVPLTFQPGEAVVRQGEPGDAFYLLDKGAAVVQDAAGKVYGQLKEGCYFGELALQAKAGEGVRAATILAAPGAGELRVLRMTRDAFAAMRAEHPAVAAGLAAGEAGYAPVAFVARLGLKDLQLSRALGVGTFGKVFLATHRGQRYALKQVAKAHVVAKGLVAHIKRERDVMAECDSPFLVSLTASFQDAQALYLLMELVLGGELFYYLQGLRAPLPEAAGRFYTACVVEAFDFLHARHYIYRDLKPENLLITATGYIKVADYSFAKRLRGGKTFTLCGTPAYLAPEQITRAGHDRAVDWWALGVLTYELLAGTSPFYHDDDMTMFKRIVDVKCAPGGGALARHSAGSDARGGAGTPTSPPSRACPTRPRTSSTACCRRRPTSACPWAATASPPCATTSGSGASLGTRCARAAPRRPTCRG